MLSAKARAIVRRIVRVRATIAEACEQYPLIERALAQTDAELAELGAALTRVLPDVSEEVAT